MCLWDTPLTVSIILHPSDSASDARRAWVWGLMAGLFGGREATGGTSTNCRVRARLLGGKKCPVCKLARLVVTRDHTTLALYACATKIDRLREWLIEPEGA